MNEEKIGQIVEKMISTQESIKSVEASTDFDSSGNEFYFKYPEGKFQWSIAETSKGERYLYFYPGPDDRNNFMRFTAEQVGYLGAENLKQLYKLIEGKAYGFDEVIKEILG